MINRRNLVLTGAAGALSLGFAPRLAFAQAASDRRFVFIIQRGAADGLGTLAPVGDPAFATQRGALAQDFADAAKLDAMFALHPNLKNVAEMYAAKEALFVHAVASPYRDRSHFDAQNVLETGGAAAYQLKDGWMNRLLGVLPADERKGIAIAATIPVALRGRVEVASYAPSVLPDASDDLLNRVAMLYAEDPQLHAIWKQATATRALTGDLAANNGRNAAATGALAARLLAADNGARIAMIETGGWDTHAQQRGRLGVQLNGLDQMIAALKTGLGPHWAKTMVLVATEFGRTVKVNGTQGTDHGTASVAWLLGGAVQGGRVVADWPGLGDSALYEGRDLRPTMGLDAVIGSAAASHFGVDPARAMPALFPGQKSARAMDGLVRV
ncbi:MULTISPECIES: DUF1501 domain-containing protein [unclassified Sphingomonas]|uniref:DUF1501 domain-containing protein n=1 Tax=unclassified Sphingomonas TaxID=196159 RepID=UPI002151E9D2|nr:MULTISPECIES: DUF1501 domain-containing protein [unclassified Sphingomonas]MCR5871730.1 DUF1501 domain-containing protein [Sphingomonas sp. J344]UUX99981.1 DUF1501 domain-containing protein [Sphingomonas sp. J315]